MNKSIRNRLTFDGKNYKNIDPWTNEDPTAWTWLSGNAQDNDKDLYGIVPFIYRVINLTANAVASMPFALVDANGEDFDVTSEWENKAGIIPNPTAFMRLCSLSLSLFGSSYWLKERNRVKVRELSYLVPTTITPTITASDGLTGFKRSTGQFLKDFMPEDIIHIWEPDARVEVGPPLAWRFKAMLYAGGLLHWEDVFVTEFLARGGIKPTMLMVKGIPNPADRERVENYWDKFIKGWFKISGKVFNAEAMEPKTVGDGIEGLQNSTLTPEKREDICVAAGIPLSVVMSNAANFATSQNDRRQFYENVILPDCELICSTLNDQLWGNLNPPIYMEPRPETLDAFQEDESSRAGAFKTYVDGGMRPEIAAQVVGVELPPGVEEYEDMFEEEEEPEPVSEVAPLAAPQPEELPEEGDQPQGKATDEMPADGAQTQEKPAQGKAIKYNDNHDELGRFAEGGGGGRAGTAVSTRKPLPEKFNYNSTDEVVSGRIAFGFTPDNEIVQSTYDDESQSQVSHGQLARGAGLEDEGSFKVRGYLTHFKDEDSVSHPVAIVYSQSNIGKGPEQRIKYFERNIDRLVNETGFEKIEQVYISFDGGYSGRTIESWNPDDLQSYITWKAMHDLDIWKRKAHKAFTKGDPLTFEFTTTYIPPAICATIASQLASVSNEKDIDIVFTGIENKSATIVMDATGGEIKALLDGIRLGVEALKRGE